MSACGKSLKICQCSEEINPQVSVCLSEGLNPEATEDIGQSEGNSTYGANLNI